MSSSQLTTSYPCHLFCPTPSICTHCLHPSLSEPAVASLSPVSVRVLSFSHHPDPYVVQLLASAAGWWSWHSDDAPVDCFPSSQVFLQNIPRDQRLHNGAVTTRCSVNITRHRIHDDGDNYGDEDSNYMYINISFTLSVRTVLSRLDYCSSLLAGIPQKLVSKVQRVMDCAARFVCSLTDRREHATPSSGVE